MMRKLSPRQKAFLAFSFAAVLLIPSGISTETQPIVTGHSTFYNGDDTTYSKTYTNSSGTQRGWELLMKGLP